MDVEDRNAEARCFNPGRSHRVGDIVILQIENDMAATRDNPSNYIGPGCGEELHANLEDGEIIAQRIVTLQRAISLVDIMTSDEFASGVVLDNLGFRSCASSVD